MYIYIYCNTQIHRFSVVSLTLSHGHLDGRLCQEAWHLAISNERWNPQGPVLQGLVCRAPLSYPAHALRTAWGLLGMAPTSVESLGFSWSRKVACVLDLYKKGNRPGLPMFNYMHTQIPAYHWRRTRRSQPVGRHPKRPQRAKRSLERSTSARPDSAQVSLRGPASIHQIQSLLAFRTARL